MSISITHVGPTADSFPFRLQHSTSGRILSLAASVDGVRLYAGTFAGVWRSNDRGQTWRQLTRPQPLLPNPDVPGALYAPHILDLAVSPVDANLVLAAAKGGQFRNSRNGIYRSTDGGVTWTIVVKPDALASSINEIIFAPDDPQLVYAALGSSETLSFIGISENAGLHWRLVRIPGSALHVAVAPMEPSGIRRVYAAGRNEVWYSTDGGNTWTLDGGTDRLTSERQILSDFQVACQIAAGRDPSPMPRFAGGTASGPGSGAHILAVEPGNPAKVYLAAKGGANGPSYYNKAGNPPDGTPCNTQCARLAGEASLWLGDFSQFDSTGMAQWEPLKGPPVYTGVSTPSGVTFVIAKPTSGGFLLFFADQSHVHVSVGTPASSASWHRLDGKDASETAPPNPRGNKLLVHVDPHALLVTADFDITLKRPQGVSFPFNLNSVLDQHLGGRIWMANDGGVNWSDDGGRSWERAKGLETLDPVNIAGLCGIGNRPALYMGTGDNDDFFTMNGGGIWGNPRSSCGDCDAWFSDVAMPKRVLEFDPRAGIEKNLKVIESLIAYPNAGSAVQTRAIPAPRNSNATSKFTQRGFRPIIQTLANEQPLADGDYVFIGARADGKRVLFRTRSISKIKTQDDWEDVSKAKQIGDVLPPGVDVVQVAGGHQTPVFYVGDPSGNLFKLSTGESTWRKIIPGGPPRAKASFAQRFFADPYNPKIIFAVDAFGVKISEDGGHSWITDVFLTEAVTAGGQLSIESKSIVTDMLFVRGERRTRFAFGSAGVTCTTDGTQWNTLLNSIALPGLPESGFFDRLSDPANRSLYVTIQGRSVLRLSPVPKPAASFTLMDFAAVLSDA